MKYQDAAVDDYGDSIELNDDEDALRLEHVKFLDPGIIELDCDSDEDFKYIDGDTLSACRPSVVDATDHELITTALPNRVIVKPLCIKLVDCYKFPWYFDRLTKDIIENSLIINNSVNNNISEQIMDIGSNEFRNVADKEIYKVVYNSTYGPDISVNKVSSETKNNNSNELNDGSDEVVNKAIVDSNQTRAPGCNKLRVIDYSKRLESISKRNEVQLLEAMSQRNKTNIDIKKNTGLVGMKVKHMSTEQQASEIKCKPKNKVDLNNKNDVQEANNMYVQAVDKALINLGTTMIPIYTAENNKYSELSKPAVTEDKINIILQNPESCENEEDSKYILAHKNYMLAKICKNTKVAEEAVRAILSESKNNNSKEEKKKKNKPMPYSKKMEMKKNETLLDGTRNSLKQQTDSQDCAMNKIITKMPLSSKEENVEKQPKSIKTSEVRESAPKNYPPTSTQADVEKYTKSHDVKKQERRKSKPTKAIPFKPDSPNQKSKTVGPSKSFPILNKFTEDILSKIQVRQLQRSQINKPSKPHKKRTKSLDKPKSNDECKSIQSSLSPKSNINKKHTPLSKSSTNIGLDTQLLDSNKKKISHTTFVGPKTLHNNKPVNSPKTKQSYSDSHSVQFPHLIEPSKLPLNTTIMKTANADDNKIKVTSNVKITHDNESSCNKTENILSQTMKACSSRKTAGTRLQKLALLEGVVSIEAKSKISENTIQPHDIPHPLLNIDTLAAEDQFTIQTIITTRNKVDVGTDSYKKPVGNLTYQTHVNKTQIPEIRPTQTQNQAAEANKHLTVHNSMQSHNSYRPQTENLPSKIFLNNMEALRQQTPMQQMNQPVYQPHVNPMWHSSWHSEKVPPNTTVVRRILNEFNAGIPVQNSNTTHNKKGLLSHPNINYFPMPARANGAVLNDMNARPVVNGRVPPTQMAFNSRPTPPGLCNVQPKTVFWSYAFPPPKPPPPPPPFPPSKETTFFPTHLQTPSSSIIGRNNDGVIKKINITAPVFDLDNKDGINKADSTPLYDDTYPAAPENTELAVTKSEMLRVLDTSFQTIISPVIHSTNLQQTLPIQSKCNPNIFKKEQPIPFESNKDNCINQEFLTYNTSSKAAVKPLSMVVEPIFKRTDTSELRTSHVNNSKVLPFKSDDVYASRKKSESCKFETNEKPAINSQGTDDASPVNLKRTLSLNHTINASLGAKYKPGPLSKKIKLNDTKSSPIKTKTKQEMLPNKGYSSPILPIPTYEKILSEIPALYKKHFDKPIIEPSRDKKPLDKADKKVKVNPNKPTKKGKHVEENSNKANKAKKISLDEYKKRSASERKTDNKARAYNKLQSDSLKNNTPRRESNVDSDLGYDSDTNLMLAVL